MRPNADPVKVYLEVGPARTFAGALDWPGWCRSGQEEGGALQALIETAPRYAHVLQGTPLGFAAPTDAQALLVVERIPGNATTDFGAPGMIPEADTLPASHDALERWQIFLTACWKAFDRAVQTAGDRELRKGPRGGGRDLLKIISHVRDAERAYLSSLGGKIKPGREDDPSQMLEADREAIRSALAQAVNGEIPALGPRGGKRWPPAYFVRRAAWHVLDHAWEIEDRLG